MSSGHRAWSSGALSASAGERWRLMRIALADDHALFRDGVASLLAAWGHEVVGQASDG